MILPRKSARLNELAQRRGVRQFIKFGIVGAGSTVVNLAVLRLLMVVFHEGKYEAATISFLVSVINGYFWNKRWTFREAQVKAVHTQFTQFLVVNVIGLGLDLLVIKLVSVPLEQKFGISVVNATLIAQLVATVFVAFWNFFANRFWTFKH